MKASNYAGTCHGTVGKELSAGAVLLSAGTVSYARTVGTPSAMAEAEPI